VIGQHRVIVPGVSLLRICSINLCGVGVGIAQ